MALTQISTAGVKNDAVTSGKISANAVGTSEIADQAVTLAKLPHGTSSNNGKFLRANNGADPTFESIPAGITINNQADNRVITATGTTDTLHSEGNLLFTGTHLGIGDRTSSPDELVHAHSASGEARIHIEGATNARLKIRAHSGESIIAFGDSGSSNPGEINYTHSSNAMSFRTNGNVRALIDDSGKFGIGTSSPDAKLQVGGSVHITGQDSVTNNALQLSFASSEGHIKVKNSNASTASNLALHTTDTSGNTNRVMSLTHGQQVGINNTDPGAFHSSGHNLVVGSGSGDEGITLYTGNSSAGVINFADGTSGSDSYEGRILYRHGDNAMTFHTNNGNEQMRIASDGHVGIGTTSPGYDLHIRRNGFADIRVENIANGGEAAINLAGKHSNGTVRLLMLKYDNSDKFRYGTQGSVTLGFETSDQNRLSIDGNGNIGAPSGTNIYNASDKRLKKNIVTLDKGLAAIDSLRPVSFNWIDGFCDDEKDTLYGFVAQEVKVVDPNLISQFGENGVVEIGETKLEDTLRVNEKFIIPILVKAVQELSTKVAALEAA